MSYTLEQIEDMLEDLPGDDLEWRFDGIQEDTLTRTGALRTSAGQNIVEPSPESSSMIIGLKPSIDFLVAAPSIVRQLLDTLAENAATDTVDKPESSLNKPISA